MRKALLVAALGAAAVLPAAPASAQCYPWLYEAIGYCSPCNVAGDAYNKVTHATGVTVADEYLQYLSCNA